MQLLHIHRKYSRKSIVLCIVSVLFIMFTFVRGSYAYVPFIDMLRSAEIVITAQVIKVHEDTTAQYAVVKAKDILKGPWSIDSLIQLPVHRRPKSGPVITTDFDAVYDSGATYLLLLTHQDKGIDIIHYPEKAQIKIAETGTSFLLDIKRILVIDTISDLSTRARQYSQLLDSPSNLIRESAASALGHIEHPDALNGLIKALDDKDHFVLGNAISGLNLLGRKGITSARAVAAIENILRYTYETGTLIRALAAQKGEEAIPYLHNFYIFCQNDRVRQRILRALSWLQDTTVVSLFRSVIYDDDIPYGMDRLKITVLDCLHEPDTATSKQYSDSVAIVLAMKALDYDAESIQIEAIKLLESRAGISFGDPENISGFDRDRAKVRNKIIGKWRKWYRNWLKIRKQ